MSETVNAGTVNISKETLEQYLASPDFKAGVIASTKASWKGSSYSVKVFENGTWEVAWSDPLTRFSDGPGVILALPTLSDEDYAQAQRDGLDDNEFFRLAFANEEVELAQRLRDTLNDTEAI